MSAELTKSRHMPSVFRVLGGEKRGDLGMDSKNAASSLYLLGLCFIVTSTGCSALPSSPTMATVPREWRKTNSWGPEGNQARAEGRLQPVYYPRRAAEWEQFAREHIQDGDILFRLGYAYKATENIQSLFIASVCDSRFSHEAIAKWEGETLYVYDAEPDPEGIRKVPFIFWMLDVADHTLAIKRVKECYRDRVPQALAYCEMIYQKQPAYDKALNPDDERFYCSELVEKAYRSAGLALSEPVPIRCLPHYPRYAWLKPFVERFSELKVDTEIFALGNEHYGLFGSPYLDLVYDMHQRADCHRKGPICQSVESYPPAAATVTLDR